MAIIDELRNGQGFLSTIAKCTKCNDFNKNRDIYTFATYYNDEHISSQKFMLIMQNPGPSHNLNECKNSKDYINQTRLNLTDWLMKKNKDFSNYFFGILKKYNLIIFDNLETYFKKQFFEDFTVTDLVKCICNTSKLSNEHINNCSDFLRQEIEKHKSVTLIFSFSKRTWNFLAKNYLSDEDFDQSITNVHGNFYRLNKINKFVIPLAHFSQRMSNYYLKLSYYEYLEEGVKNYIKR